MGRRYREKEERRELQATIEIGSTSSDDTLRFHNLPIVWPSYEVKKKGRGKDKITVEVKVEVRGQDVFARGKKAQTTLWEKFLLFGNYVNGNLISLINDTDRLAEEYYSYLINSYPASDRYRNLDMEGQSWLRKVIRLAVKYHIMENKLAGHLNSFYDENDDRDYFCNDFALYFYVLLRTIKRSMQGAAREIHHIIRDEEKAEFYLKRLFDEHYNQLRQVPFPQRDNILRLLQTDTKQGDDDTNENGMVRA